MSAQVGSSATVSKIEPELTLEGTLFLETATAMLNTYDRFVEKAKSLKRDAVPRLRVQTLQHVDAASFVILKRVRDFMRQNPGIQVDVHESLDFNTAERIAKGEIDAGYYGLHLSVPEVEGDIDIVPLTNEELILWVDRDSAIAKADMVTPDLLAGAVIPFWVGPANDLEVVYREFLSAYGVDTGLSPRFCSSREDFFLNRVRENDVVIFTRGAEDIGAVKVRDERVIVPFSEPI